MEEQELKQRFLAQYLGSKHFDSVRSKFNQLAKTMYRASAVCRGFFVPKIGMYVATNS